MSAFQLVIPDNQCYNSDMKNIQNTPEYNLQRFDLFSILLSVVNDEHAGNSTNKIIAEYLLRNLNHLDELTIYDVAEECFVSRSSIHRFLRQIGFDQFGSLGQYIKDSNQHWRAFYDYVNRENFLDNVKSKMNEMMDDISQLADSEPVKQLVRLLHDYENVYFLSACTSASATQHLQEELLAMGKLIHVRTSSNVNADFLTELNKEDLLIVCSITGNYAFAVSKDLENVEAAKILITLNHTDLFKNYYDKIVYMSRLPIIDDSIHSTGLRNAYTKYGLLFFLDIIYNQYVKNIS